MANITINNYVQGAQLYGVELVSGSDYIQSATPSFVALLTTGTNSNGVYSGSILANASTIQAPNSEIIAPVSFEPVLKQDYSGLLSVIVSDVVVPFTAELSGSGSNPWNIEKNDCTLIDQNLTHQYRSEG